MQITKKQFAFRLRLLMQEAGYDPKPAVLEREFNTRHWGKPMSLHGVRLWLLGETMPDYKKLDTLSKWLGVTAQELGYGGDTARAEKQRGCRWDSGIGYEDREVLDAYLKLPVPQRRLIRETILTFHKVYGDA